jgi:hypothetical protein
MHVFLSSVKMVDNVLKIQQQLIVLDVNVQLATRAKFVTHPSLSHVCKICFSHHLVVTYLCSPFLSAGVCNPVCQNGGFCNVNVCECPTGYTGTICEIRGKC